MNEETFDVVVVGAGNAALCAAISARQVGARVLVLEKAPEDEKCGNSYFTGGGFRVAHGGLEDLREDVLSDIAEAEASQTELLKYSAQDFYNTLMEVTRGQSDEMLATTLIDNSRAAVSWLRDLGVRFIPIYAYRTKAADGTFHFKSDVTIEAVGGGAGLVEFLLDRCAALGIEIRFATGAVKLLQDGKGRINGVRARSPDGHEDITCKAVVLACGGFEANPEWRARYFGRGWDLARVRGTRHNTGDGIAMALEIGALPYGNWSGCNSVGWDYSAPAFGDPHTQLKYQKHSYPLGIMVNKDGNRFVDEGADFWNKTYVKFGKAVMDQPQGTAVQIFDQKTIHLLRDEYRIREVTKVTADTIERLATEFDINQAQLRATVKAYNTACQPGDYDPARRDGVAATGITPVKSNWALPLDTPPYEAYLITTGITFTFGGLKIDEQGGVQDLSYRSIPGLYAAGELVGGLFYENYPSGTGLTSGSVFGKRAGQNAAEYATSF